MGNAAACKKLFGGFLSLCIKRAFACNLYSLGKHQEDTRSRGRCETRETQKQSRKEKHNRKREISAVEEKEKGEMDVDHR